MVDTANLALPLLAAAQSQKHVTHNEALFRLDALTQLAVLALSQNTPPPSPASGDRYVIGSAPTGSFVGQNGQLASFDGQSWRFLTPKAGWIVFNGADGFVYAFDGTTWRKLSDSISQLQNLSGLGIGTASDNYNTLAAKLNAALFAARGTGEGGSGDLRLTLNKQASGNTASQLYQTNWSGRAETGLSGDDNWHLKVSADGSAWREALSANAASGAVRMDLVLSGRATQANGGRFESDFDGATASAMVLSDLSTVASSSALVFRKAGATVGSIKLAATGTSFLTTSDYRLKQNIEPLADGLARLSALKPCRFAFKTEPDHTLDGFIAHEVAAVVPDAVSGEKNAVDSKGEILPQSVDLGRLVPLLVAAVQALTLRLDALEARR